ncbi:MAG: triose-phosphate isomerase [Aigarchaeota archaeon]|nr:triose-phosphate isomerase [Aigarchaeota archaeon]MDW8092409.1 triose-phosphate isomerase [Nitrososphaerota archaeon]
MARRITLPLIVLNYKAYSESTGPSSERLTSVVEEVQSEYNVSLFVAPQTTDIYRLTSRYSVRVLAQHVDPVRPGSYTGHVTVQAIKSAGASGSLINHSEMTMRLSEIATVIGLLREEGLTSILCTDTLQSSIAGAMLRPDVIAIEPPELIGTGISVSTARPELVRQTVEAVKGLNRDVIVLCGAGISNSEDVYRAIDLGSEGVLLSSAFVKSKDPKKLLREMCELSIKAFESAKRL